MHACAVYSQLKAEAVEVVRLQEERKRHRENIFNHSDPPSNSNSRGDRGGYLLDFGANSRATSPAPPRSNTNANANSPAPRPASPVTAASKMQKMERFYDEEVVIVRSKHNMRT